MASVSGGACAIYADLAHIHGLATPPFAQATQAGLRQVLPAFAATLNPLDATGVTLQNPALWNAALPLLIGDPGFGLIVVSTGLPNTPAELANQRTTYAAIGEGYAASGKRAVVMSFSLQDCSAIQLEARAEFGLDITLPGIELGVRALAHLQRWSECLLADAAQPGRSS